MAIADVLKKERTTRKESISVSLTLQGDAAKNLKVLAAGKKSSPREVAAALLEYVLVDDASIRKMLTEYRSAGITGEDIPATEKKAARKKSEPAA